MTVWHGFLVYLNEGTPFLYARMYACVHLINEHMRACYIRAQKLLIPMKTSKLEILDIKWSYNGRKCFLFSAKIEEKKSFFDRFFMYLKS